MVKDKVACGTFTIISGLNAVIAAFSANPVPQGIAAVSFALLAIAWAPRA